MGECPPSNKGVGCKYGIRGRPYSISEIFCETEASLCRLDGLVVVKEPYPGPRIRAERLLTRLVHTYQPHSHHNSSGTHMETLPFDLTSVSTLPILHLYNELYLKFKPLVCWCIQIVDLYHLYAGHAE